MVVNIHVCDTGISIQVILEIAAILHVEQRGSSPPGNIIIFAYDILVCEMKQSCYIWLNKILSQSINIHITLNYFSITTKTNKTFYPIIVMFIFNITYPVACLLSSTDYLFWVSILLILYFQIVWEVLLSTV